MMNIAVLLDNPYTDDRRVIRENKALVQAGYRVFVYCVRKDTLPEEEEIDGCRILRIFSEDIYDVKKQGKLSRYISAIVACQPQVLHCHDQHMLHVGGLVKQAFPDIKLIYDSHELFHAWPMNLSRAGDPVLFLKSWIVKKIQILRERRNRRYIDHLITVNDSLANDLQSWLSLKHPPIVLRNIPEYGHFHKDQEYFHRHFNWPANKRILVFIGSAIYRHTLNLEQVIQETASIPHLAFLIICGEQGGKKEVEKWVKDQGYSHVFFYPKLKPADIGPALAACDAGLVPTWNKKDLSYWYALDNKLFEYMMSEIPVLATQQPEYKNIVEKFNIGICVNPDKKGDYAQGLLRILEKPEYWNENLGKAKEMLHWDIEKEALLSLYKHLIPV